MAEAPPADPSRYFYFENVHDRDSLYLEVAKALLLSLSVDRLREQKTIFLERMRNQRIWLIDVAEEPIPPRTDKVTYLEGWIDSLVERCLEVDPRRILLLVSTVYDVAYQRLLEAGLPVVDVRIPFPGSGRQKEFRAAFWQAMGEAGWDPDPVILDGNCITFWLDALEHTEPPDEDDPLRAQKIALVRMFYYWPYALSYTQGVRDEVEGIPDPGRLLLHQQWMDIHLRELPSLDADVLEPVRNYLDEFGVNQNDAMWLAEAMVHRAPLVITWDQPLLGQTAGLEEVEVISPEAGWSALSVPNGSSTRITPTPDNPLSQQSWWNV